MRASPELVKDEGIMRRRFALLITLTTVAAVAVTAQPAATAEGAHGHTSTKALRDAVTVTGVLAHEQALQRIADRNDDNRAAGTPGYSAAAGYVEKTLRSAGYSVREQPFTFPFFNELAPPVLTEVAPTATTFPTTTFAYSGSGDVTGALVPTDNVMVPPAPVPTSTSGCDVSDFPPASPSVPKVALIQRGTCSFEVKALNAQAAGYAAAVFFNEGQPGRDAADTGTLGAAVTIPVVGVLSYADGAALYAAATSGSGARVHVRTSTENVPNARTMNIVAESKGGDPRHVLLVHAPLDALPTGPGINEDGSGVSTALEIAQQMSRLRMNPRYKIRFVFFGAEETRAVRDPDTGAIGLQGSYHYAQSLSPAELGRVFAAVDLDSLGSPNFARFVFNGDGPPGSEQIEKMFTDYFSGRRLATEPIEPTTFDGSSLGPLIDAGIPTGGLFGGAADLKTPEEAATYGGTAGVSYDACYHQACDDIGNLNPTALSQFGDAAADVIWRLAAQGLPTGGHTSG